MGRPRIAAAMSYLISRILLAILMIPLAGLVYLVAFVGFSQRAGWFPGRERTGFIIGGGAAWVFMAAWWYLLWRSTVKWTPRRHRMSLASLAVAAIAGCIV